jgi:hypothetical protein
MGTDDARQLRKDIGQHAILQVLARVPNEMTIQQVAATIASDLRFPTSVHPDLIANLIVDLEERGLTTTRNGGWRLTESGHDAARTVPTETALHILEGARVVQSALQTLTGYSFTDLQFTQLWSIFLDFLAELFHSKGLAVICAINDVLSGTAKSAVPLEQFASQGAAKIRAGISIPEMGEVMEEAVVDIFTERSGPAFEWLARVCERFIALCALGLETTSAEEIRSIIARYRLVLDSDIVITFLCQGERGHHSVREVIGRWQRLGGKLLLAQQVLEEVAYHAFISDREFRETRQLAPTLKGGTDLQRYLSNAFVRAFYTVESDPNSWPAFRAQFAGATAHDYANIVEILRDEMMVDALPSTFDGDLARDITACLRELSSDSERIQTAYFGDPGRLGRDGQLLATIAETRKSDRAAFSDARIMLLSSSMRLREADNRFRDRLGEPETVISRAAVSYLISLIPGAGLGAVSLRKALFEFGAAAYFTDTEHFALKVIKASGTVTMPWAKRPALRRQLEANLRREADNASVPIKQFRKTFVSGKDPGAAAQIVATTVSDLALQDPVRLRLERELAEAKRQLVAATAKPMSAPQPRRPRKTRGK